MFSIVLEENFAQISIMETNTLLTAKEEGDEIKSKVDYIETVKGLCAALLYLVTIVTSASSVQLLEHRIDNFELNTLACCSAAVMSSIGIVADQTITTN